MTKPWVDGPRELLQHSLDHLASGSDFDKRIAMIGIDNAVELIIKTYLGLPNRARGSKGPSRKELDEVENSFPALLDTLEKYDSNRIMGIELGDIEWFHRIRNQLYHSGNGITVESTKVDTYFEIALNLFEILFGFPPNLDLSNHQQSLFGEFLTLWVYFDKEFHKQLPSKQDFAYHWKRDYLRSINPELVDLFNSISDFRNDIVHGIIEPETKEIKENINKLRKIMKILHINPK